MSHPFCPASRNITDQNYSNKKVVAYALKCSSLQNVSKYQKIAACYLQMAGHRKCRLQLELLGLVITALLIL